MIAQKHQEHYCRDFFGGGVFFEVAEGPGGFRKVREAVRVHFQLISFNTDFMMPSYGKQ